MGLSYGVLGSHGGILGHSLLALGRFGSGIKLFQGALGMHCLVFGRHWATFKIIKKPSFFIAFLHLGSLLGMS